MHCIVTAGPTFEPLDKVRRLTNFSTGRLGSELAEFLVEQGHQVTLLIGQQATYRGECHDIRVETFTTTSSLRKRLHKLSARKADAVFHAAAVSDFCFGRIWSRSQAGKMTQIRSGKISTRRGDLLAELTPTTKIIAELRQWFPKARLVGWKYEVDGIRADVIALARRQIKECRTDACVANGPAYGLGFGLVGRNSSGHFRDKNKLFEALHELASRQR